MKSVPRIAASVFALLVLGAVVKLNWLDRPSSPLPSLVLQFEATATGPSTAQVVVGGQQVPFQMEASSDFKPYQIPLPDAADPVSWIRLDPCQAAGTVVLRNLCITAGGTPLCRIADRHIESLNPRARITMRGGEITVVHSSNDDYPALLFSRIYPIRTAVDTYPRITRRGLAMAWGAGLAGVGVLVWALVRAMRAAPRSAGLVWAGVGLAILGARLLTIRHIGVSFHFWDSWSEPWCMFLPFADGNLSWHYLFAPCNEHRIVFTRLLSLGVFQMVGQWDNLSSAAVNAVLYAGVMLGAGVMMWCAAGRRHTGAIAVLTLVLGALPFAWENTVWGFQSQFYFLVAFSLLTMWLWTQHEPWSAGWIAGLGTAVCGIFTMGAGITPVFVVAAIMGLRLFKEPARWRSHATTLGACAVTFAIYKAVAVSQHNYGMLAKSVMQFMIVFGKTMSWPFVEQAWVWPLVWAPLIVLAVVCLWPRQAPTRLDWLLLAIGGWVFVNAVGMGVYRGGFSCGPASRYMDITSLGAYVNAIAVLALMEKTGVWHRVRHAGAAVAVWGTVMLCGVADVTSTEMLSRAGNRIDQQQEAKAVMARFLKDDRLLPLLGLRELQLPFPDALSLASWLRCPRVRDILPSSIRPPVPVETTGQQGFIPDGVHPRHPLDPAEKTWGSFTQYGNRWTGLFESKPLRELRYPWLEFEIIGDFGEGIDTPALSLRLVDPLSGRLAHPSHPDAVRDQWARVAVRAPCSTPAILAVDNDPVFWLGFKEPREKSSGAVWADRTLQWSGWLLAAGIGMLVWALRGARPANDAGA